MAGGADSFGRRCADGMPALLSAAANGDARATDDFWCEALSLVVRFAHSACRRLGIRGDCADDIVQDTMLRLLRRPAAELAGIRKWDAWLATVTSSAALSLRRTAKRRSRERTAGGGPGEGGVGRVFNSADPASPDPAEESADSELVARLEATLTEMPKEKAEVVRLHLDGMSHAEIAARTGRPANTVGVWIWRAKRLLQAGEPGGARQ